MEHIQKDFEGSSVQRWEQNHHIVRVVDRGCEYVLCTNWEGFQQICEDERNRRKREYIADQQERAYL